jgi:gliding motility-associated-like protein
MRIIATILILSLSFFPSTLFGQIGVSNILSPFQLVNDVLIGVGINATNIKLNGSTINALLPNDQLGKFEKLNSMFPISKGVVMSTGNVATLPGVANQFSSTNTFFGSDPDLVSISGAAINDAAVLEFDFVAQGDSMNFKYMFGSEEYPEFVGGVMNDAFGFFLSGPGINGPFSNNSVNLAVLPNTNTAVSVNTVNQNVNSIYYTPNNTSFYGTSTKLDAYTTVLVAAKGLICGQTYHIKLAIGDGGDSVYDSAVFLEAESFKSNSVKIEAESTFGAGFTDSVIAEGCVATNLKFIRPSYLSSSTQTFYVSFGGTADPVLDFLNLQDSVVFGIGQDTVSFLITPIADLIPEPQEHLDVYGYTITQCGDTVYASVRLYVVDKYDLTFDLPDEDTSFCLNDQPEVSVTNHEGSIPPFTYLWSFGGTTNPIHLPNNGQVPDTLQHIVEVTDGCGNVFLDTVILKVTTKLPIFSVSPGPNLISDCINDSIEVTASIVDPSIGPYIYNWANGAHTAGTYLNNNGVHGDTIPFDVTLTDGCGNTVTETVVMTTDFEVPNFYMFPLDTLLAICPSSLMEARVVFGTGNYGPYTHTWSNGTVNDTAHLANNGVVGAQQWHYATTVNACGMSDYDSVLVVNDFTLPEAELLNEIVVLNCIPDSAPASVTITNGALGPFSYLWSNGETGATTYFFDSGTNNISFPYSVEVTDACGFTVEKNGTVEIKQTLTIDSLWTQASAACSPTGILSGFISGFQPVNQSGLIYEWKGPGANGLDYTQASVWQNRASGWYYFTATDTVCSVSDSVFLGVKDPPMAIATASPAGGEVPLTVTFTNSSQNTDSYIWDFHNGSFANANDLSPQTTTYTEPGEYWMMLIANQGSDCPDTTYIKIDVVDPLPEAPFVDPVFDTPNVFSPNGDGTNEYFTLNVKYAKEVYLYIYTRWGNKMFEDRGTNPKWDGYSASGEKANDGVYYYNYEIVDLQGEIQTGQGLFHLINR